MGDRFEGEAVEAGSTRDIRLRILILWLALVPLALLWITARQASEPAQVTVVPEVARPGQPVIATYRLANPGSQEQTVHYRLYAEGRLLAEGTTQVPPGASKSHQYLRRHPLALGEQVTFALQSDGPQGPAEETVALPPYPPQVLSSFVSFATFATSVMSSLTSMSYYSLTFGPASVVNLGLLMTFVLVSLLIFLEMTQPLLRERRFGVGALRLRLGRISGILFVIFMGVIFTKVALILSV